MTDYSKMDDVVINHLVDIATKHQPGDGNSKDYCNNPADAWPIILSEKIMLSPRCANDEWKAQIYLGRVDIFDNYASSWNKNPLRAAMIAFLMMKEIGNV